ncbi:MAG: redoxin family protein [Methylococcales bacterium]|nr:redoxin family protein [Methylococcales bacterium]
MNATTPLPDWQVSTWLNSETHLSLHELQGNVVMIHSFQMLCPGCVQHAIPQAERVHRLYAGKGLVVIGLHTVFEHHEVMTEAALRAFLYENRITHPVGIDQADSVSAVPKTMRDYGMQGTPSLLLVDHTGRLRVHEFGQIDDLRLGMWLGQLLAQA